MCQVRIKIGGQWLAAYKKFSGISEFSRAQIPEKEQELVNNENLSLVDHVSDLEQGEFLPGSFQVGV